MANVINSGDNAEKHIKPDYIVATLFDGTETADTEAQGDSYILEDVIEDTTSLNQDENTTTTIECETSDSPIKEIVKLGKWQFSSQIGDTQKALLQALVGFTYDEVAKRVYAPSNYRNKYVKVAIVFQTEDSTEEKPKYMAYVVPRLQLNSRLTIEQLNSNLARINLAGTATNFPIEVNDKKMRVPFYIEEEYTLPVSTNGVGG